MLSSSVLQLKRVARVRVLCVFIIYIFLIFSGVFSLFKSISYKPNYDKNLDNYDKNLDNYDKNLDNYDKNLDNYDKILDLSLKLD